MAVLTRGKETNCQLSIALSRRRFHRRLALKILAGFGLTRLT
jgi:hypothetical protein